MLAINLFKGIGNQQNPKRVSVNVICWAIVYVLISCLELRKYVNLQSPVFLLGLFCLIQVSVGESGRERSCRFAFFSVALGLLTVLLPVKTILYLSCSTALLFLMESNYGKVNSSALIILLVMAPVFEYGSVIFSFPLRLELTRLAALIMSFSDQLVISHGNTLELNGNEFSVDPECMGLYMLETSLLLGLLIANFYQRKLKSKIQLWKVLIILAIIALLNVVANLLRIVTLVQFNILPGMVMHEIIGLVCLLIYVLIPGVILARKIVEYKIKPLEKSAVSFLHEKTWRLMFFLVGICLAFAVFNVSKTASARSSTAGNVPDIHGYKVERVDAEIIKLTAPGALIYVKKINGFFTVEHNPMICWRGSGYNLSSIKIMRSAGHEIYSARLKKDADQLFTAWWYDNKKSVTNSQSSWRWDVFLGSPDYFLINVTSENPDSLDVLVSDILSQRQLAAALSP